ncbi:MAG: recombinase RecT [Rickettsiales bacterium]|jgi:recombination protein RecT|nr:recombinase RecT [Rickettsiales bacterium]
MEIPIKKEIISCLDNEKNKGLIKRMLGGNNSFEQELLSLIINDEKLSSCKPQTIIEGALQVKALNLSFNKTIGDAYLIPYEKKTKNKDGKYESEFVAQVQISYKGLKKILLRNPLLLNIVEYFAKEGEVEFTGYGDDNFIINAPTGEITLDDIDKRNSKNTIGYAVIINLKDGRDFRKFWSVRRCREHGLKYSKSVSNGNFFTGSPWSVDFDAMAMKTVIKSLAKSSGLLRGIDEKAIELDQATIENEKYEYVDGVETKAIENNTVPKLENNNTPFNKFLTLLDSQNKTEEEKAKLIDEWDMANDDINAQRALYNRVRTTNK